MSLSAACLRINALQIAQYSFVGNAVVISVAAATFLLLCPLRLEATFYADLGARYASLGVKLFGAIDIFSSDTSPRSPASINVNGREKKIFSELLSGAPLKAFNNVCVTRITQLAGFGLARDGGAYAAVVNSCLTDIFYGFIRANGGRTQLENYMLFDASRDDILWSAKVTGYVNALAVIKLFVVLFWEKMNERKR